MNVRSSAASMYALVAIAMIVVIAALALALRVSPASSPAAGTPAAAHVFAAGRSTVYTTPRVKVSARLQHPASVDAESIRWQVTAAGSTSEFSDQSGTGSQAQFTSPASGSVVLTTTMLVGGSPRTFTTRFVVQSAEQVVASRVEITGDVTINGSPAIAGEALPEGTLIDASRGSISYTVSAARNLNGRIRMAGSEFVLTSRTVGQRKLTTARMRVEAGASERLQADVEHLDGVRYIAVESPDAVAMVKGTSFGVDVGPDGTSIDVDHGLVMVFDRVRMFAAPVYVPTGTRAEVERSDLVEAGSTWEAMDDAAWAVDLPDESPDAGSDDAANTESDDANGVSRNEDNPDATWDLFDEVLEHEVEHGKADAMEDTNAVWATMPALPKPALTERSTDRGFLCEDRPVSRRCAQLNEPACSDCEPTTPCDDCDVSSPVEPPPGSDRQPPECEKASCRQRPGRPSRPDNPEWQCPNALGCSVPGNPGSGDLGGTMPDVPDQPGYPDKPVKPERPEPPAKPERPSQPDRPNRPDRPDSPSRPDRPDRPDSSSRPDRPVRPERPPRPERPDRPNRQGTPSPAESLP
jgi:hypothetical protein